jgi:hypothetical protein
MRTPKIPETPHPYPNFAQALRQFGADSVEIGKALGVSRRAALMYMNGQLLPKTAIVKSHPILDEALTLDFAARRKKPIKRMPKSAENMS